MANEVTTTVGAALIATDIVERAFYDAAYDYGVCPPLVKSISLAGQPTLTVDVPKMPKLTALAITEGDDMTPSAMAATKVSVTVGLAGIMVKLLDMFLSADIIGNPAVYAAELGKAGWEKIDTDIMAQVADFATTVGSTGVNLSVDNYLTGIYELLNGKARPPFVAVGHPIQKHDLRSAIAASTGAIFGAGSPPESLFTPGMPEMFFNVVFFETTTAASVNTNADRQGFMGPVGDGCGLVYVEKWAPRLRFQRDESFSGGATEIVESGCYAAECCNTAANGGVKVVTDHE